MQLTTHTQTSNTKNEHDNTASLNPFNDTSSARAYTHAYFVLKRFASAVANAFGESDILTQRREPISEISTPKSTSMPQSNSPIHTLNFNRMSMFERSSPMKVSIPGAPSSTEQSASTKTANTANATTPFTVTTCFAKPITIKSLLKDSIYEYGKLLDKLRSDFSALTSSVSGLPSSLTPKQIIDVCKEISCYAQSTDALLNNSITQYKQQIDIIRHDYGLGASLIDNFLNELKDQFACQINQLRGDENNYISLFNDLFNKGIDNKTIKTLRDMSNHHVSHLDASRKRFASKFDAYRDDIVAIEGASFINRSLSELQSKSIDQNAIIEFGNNAKGPAARSLIEGYANQLTDFQAGMVRADSASSTIYYNNEQVRTCTYASN